MTAKTLLPDNAKIGWCCITLDSDGKKPEETAFKTTTVAAAARLEPKERNKKIAGLVTHNVKALYAVVGKLRHADQSARMFRITSEMLPLYTHETAQGVYSDPGVRAELARNLKVVGDAAKEYGVRLSFHPGQYTVLNSQSIPVRANALRDFDYHADVAEWLGYQGRGVDDFCINVHGGPKDADAVARWAKTLKTMSKRSHALLTLENDEFSWDADSLYRLCEEHEIRMVLDVHHEWVKTGKWVGATHYSGALLKELWAGRRPKIHLSVPKPDAIGRPAKDRPARKNKMLIGDGLPEFEADVMNRAHVRQHADYIWAAPFVDYAIRWIKAGVDIQVEAKAKNLAQLALLDDVQQHFFSEAFK